MTARRTDMRKLQELVHRHRQGRSARDIARLLQMSRNTVRSYVIALTSANVLDGAPAELPELAVIKAALPARPPPQEASTVADWLPRVAVRWRLVRLSQKRRRRGTKNHRWPPVGWRQEFPIGQTHTNRVAALFDHRLTVAAATRATDIENPRSGAPERSVITLRATRSYERAPMPKSRLSHSITTLEAVR